MTKQEAAIVTAYTGVLIGEWNDFQKYAEKILNRPIFTDEFPKIADLIAERAKPDFMNIKITED